MKFSQNFYGAAEQWQAFRRSSRSPLPWERGELFRLAGFRMRCSREATIAALLLGSEEGHPLENPNARHLGIGRQIFSEPWVAERVASRSRSISASRFLNQSVDQIRWMRHPLASRICCRKRSRSRTDFAE